VVGGVGRRRALTEENIPMSYNCTGESFEHRFHWQSGLFVDTLSPNSRDDIERGHLLQHRESDFFSLSTGKKKRHAVYSQGTYDLTDKLNVTVGARYTEDLRRQLTTPTDVPQNNLSAKFHATTWNVSLQYQFNHDMMLYAASRKRL